MQFPQSVIRQVSSRLGDSSVSIATEAVVVVPCSIFACLLYQCLEVSLCHLIEKTHEYDFAVDVMILPFVASSLRMLLFALCLSARVFLSKCCPSSARNISYRVIQYGPLLVKSQLVASHNTCDQQSLTCSIPRFVILHLQKRLVYDRTYCKFNELLEKPLIIHHQPFS